MTELAIGGVLELADEKEPFEDEGKDEREGDGKESESEVNSMAGKS